MRTSVPSIAYIPRERAGGHLYLKSLWARLQLMWQVQRERNALSDLDEHTLKDIGLGRRQVETEANRSFFDLPEGRD